MLCQICQTINIDALIPPESALDNGTISGTTHHSTFANLQNAASAGCELCKAVDRCAHKQIRQEARLRRLLGYPVELKMHLKGHANSEYEGACKLFVSCQATIVAQLEVYVARGMEFERCFWERRLMMINRVCCCEC